MVDEGQEAVEKTQYTFRHDHKACRCLYFMVMLIREHK